LAFIFSICCIIFSYYCYCWRNNPHRDYLGPRSKDRPCQVTSVTSHLGGRDISVTSHLGGRDISITNHLGGRGISAKNQRLIWGSLGSDPPWGPSISVRNHPKANHSRVSRTAHNLENLGAP